MSFLFTVRLIYVNGKSLPVSGIPALALAKIPPPSLVSMRKIDSHLDVHLAGSRSSPPLFLRGFPCFPLLETAVVVGNATA
jgi:hypothetical protein